MVKTLKSYLKLHNSYFTNTFIYFLRSIPIIGKKIPYTLYSSGKIKNFIFIISAIVSSVIPIITSFIYVLFIIYLFNIPFAKNIILPSESQFLNMLLLLSIIGTLVYNIFNIDQKSFYAIHLLNMEARKYLLCKYFTLLFIKFYSIIPAFIILSVLLNFNIYFFILLPAAIMCMKLCFQNFLLILYKKFNYVYRFKTYTLLMSLILLIFAFVTTKLSLVLNKNIYYIIFILFIPFGIYSATKIFSFNLYKSYYIDVYTKYPYNGEININKIEFIEMDKHISYNDISTNKVGFSFLNYIFEKRNKKTLLKIIYIQSIIIILVYVSILTISYLFNGYNDSDSKILKSFSPFFVYILYLLNIGDKYTKALFVNCDKYMFGYSFYKTPKNIISLFKIRTISIIKYNIVPALLLAIGYNLILIFTKNANILDIMCLFISLICWSIIFSLYHLNLYYLLQPYTAELDVKSPIFKILSFVTFVVSLLFMRAKLSIYTLTISSVIFFIIFMSVSFIIVYKYSPKTFVLRK